jgi:hypothetical protein
MRGMHCGGGGRGVAPFYRVGEVGRGGGAVRGMTGGGGALSRHRLLKGETTGHRPFKGEIKRRQLRIFSISTWHWRVTNGGARSGSAPESGGGGWEGWR